jgi:peptidoglycan/LPS O-acetylase OafA/YrhL
LKNSSSLKIKINKLLGLEVIRFLSAFSVLVWHYTHFFFVRDKPVNLIYDNLPFYNFLKFFYIYGLNFGVTVFWGISGFIFFWKYHDLITNQKFEAKKFLVFRLSRLYPLHILTLIFVMILQNFYFLKNNYYYVYQTNDLENFLLQIFFVSNWVSFEPNSFNGPIWSVSAEVFSYIIFFFSVKKFRKSLLINIFIIIFCIFLRACKLSNPITDCLTIFFVCGSAAIIFKNFSASNYKSIINLFFFVLVIIIPIFVILFNLTEYQYFIYTFQLIYIPLFLYVFAIEFNFLNRIRGLLEFFGNMTYSSYLLQFPIQLFISIICLYFEIKINFYSNFFFIIYIIFVLSFSYLSFFYFENPSKKYLRRKFS